jgi:hypothetical protein
VKLGDGGEIHGEVPARRIPRILPLGRGRLSHKFCYISGYLRTKHSIVTKLHSSVEATFLLCLTIHLMGVRNYDL